MGTYCHGLFEEQTSCQSMLEWAGLENAEAIDYFKRREDDIDRLADCIEEHINLDAIYKLLNIELPWKLSGKSSGELPGARTGTSA